MNPVLLGRLKDAGFPMNIKCDHQPGQDCNCVENWEPTLEELIDGCGIYFKSLHWYLNSKWGAMHEDGRFFYGPISRDAVASLWLSTHGG